MLPLLEVPSNMSGMPVPSVSDVVAIMWAVMSPFQGLIALILGLVLALGLVRLLMGMAS